VRYWREFGAGWRALAAAGLGLAFGYTLNNYVTNVFAPHLMTEFGWSRSEFALLGLAPLVSLVCQPLGGRLTDVVGVRRLAAVGVVSGPLIYIALSLMKGDFLAYFLLTVAQIAIVCGATSVAIYSRLISQAFDRARGAALGVMACAPPVAGAAIVPLLSGFIDHHGWRAGYLVLAAVTAAAGLVAILLIPVAADGRRRAWAADPTGTTSYRVIVRNPAFGLIMGAILLGNLSLSLQTTQLKVVLLEAGMTSTAGSLMISLYAIGVMAGRLACGAALDRFPAHAVAAVALGLPAVGLFLLATGLPAPLLLGAGVLIIGLSLGAEADVGAYLVMRFFPPEIFSSVLGIAVAAFALSGALGALLLSLTLHLTGGFTVFFVLSGLAALIGAGLMLGLARTPPFGEAGAGIAGLRTEALKGAN
jgi:MFS family permease